MEDAIKAINLIIENITTIFVGIVTIATVLNQFMPKIITNSKLAKLEAVTSKLSTGNKKAKIILEQRISNERN